MSTKQVECPQCGYSRPEPAFPAHLRNAVIAFEGDTRSLVDVGFRCPECSCEFGFEVLTDAFLRAVGFP